MIAITQETDRKIIFFDIDLLSAPNKNETDKNPNATQECFTKYCISTNAPDSLYTLHDDEILLLDQWNDDLANNLTKIASYGEKCDFIIISDKITQDKLRLICDYKGVSCKDLICHSDKQQIVDAISSYIISDNPPEN